MVLALSNIQGQFHIFVSDRRPFCPKAKLDATDARLDMTGWPT